MTKRNEGSLQKAIASLSHEQRIKFSLAKLIGSEEVLKIERRKKRRKK